MVGTMCDVRRHDSPEMWMELPPLLRVHLRSLHGLTSLHETTNYREETFMVGERGSCDDLELQRGANAVLQLQSLAQAV